MSGAGDTSNDWPQPSQEDVEGFFSRIVTSNTADLTTYLDQFGPAFIDARDSEGRTALIGAAGWGHDKAVESLLEKGAAIEAKDNGGWTALTWAANGGHDSIVLLLLKKGADIGAVDNWGLTALAWAERAHQAGAAALLKEWVERLQNMLAETHLQKLKQLRSAKPALQRKV